MEESLATIKKKDMDAIRREDIEFARHMFSVGEKIKILIKDPYGEFHLKRVKIVRFHPHLVELQHLRTISYGDLVVYMRNREEPIKMYDDWPQGRSRKKGE